MADDIIVEEDAADSCADSYIWKYFTDISGHGEKGTCIANSVTEILLECPQPVLLPKVPGRKTLWQRCLVCVIGCVSTAHRD